MVKQNQAGIVEWKGTTSAERALARATVNTYASRGHFPPKPCAVCGAGDAVKHHPDYSKPLEIIWLCHVHHVQVHRGVISTDGLPITTLVRAPKQRRSSAGRYLPIILKENTMAERQHFALTSQEYDEFLHLRPIPGEAFDFWRKVARDRKVDPGSIISEFGRFTALPLGHRDHWCHPAPLHLSSRPRVSQIEH
jgi:hypothetical protein